MVQKVVYFYPGMEYILNVLSAVYTPRSVLAFNPDIFQELPQCIPRINARHLSNISIDRPA